MRFSKKVVFCDSYRRQGSAEIIEENKLYENGRQTVNVVDLVWWQYNQL